LFTVSIVSLCFCWGLAPWTANAADFTMFFTVAGSGYVPPLGKFESVCSTNAYQCSVAGIEGGELTADFPTPYVATHTLSGSRGGGAACYSSFDQRVYFSGPFGLEVYDQSQARVGAIISGDLNAIRTCVIDETGTYLYFSGTGTPWDGTTIYRTTLERAAGVVISTTSVTEIFSTDSSSGTGGSNSGTIFALQLHGQYIYWTKYGGVFRTLVDGSRSTAERVGQVPSNPNDSVQRGLAIDSVQSKLYFTAPLQYQYQWYSDIKMVDLLGSITTETTVLDGSAWPADTFPKLLVLLNTTLIVEVSESSPCNSRFYEIDLSTQAQHLFWASPECTGTSQYIGLYSMVVMPGLVDTCSMFVPSSYPSSLLPPEPTPPAPSTTTYTVFAANTQTPRGINYISKICSNGVYNQHEQDVFLGIPSMGWFGDTFPRSLVAAINDYPDFLAVYAHNLSIVNTIDESRCLPLDNQLNFAPRAILFEDKIMWYSIGNVIGRLQFSTDGSQFVEGNTLVGPAIDVDGGGTNSGSVFALVRAGTWLYYSKYDGIFRANVSTGLEVFAVQQVYSAASNSNPRGLVIHPTSGLIYFVDQNNIYAHDSSSLANTIFLSSSDIEAGLLDASGNPLQEFKFVTKLLLDDSVNPGVLIAEVVYDNYDNWVALYEIDLASKYIRFLWTAETVLGTEGLFVIDSVTLLSGVISCVADSSVSSAPLPHSASAPMYALGILCIQAFLKNSFIN